MRGIATIVAAFGLLAALVSEEAWTTLWQLSLYGLLFTFIISLASKRSSWLFIGNLGLVMVLGYIALERYH